MKNLLLKFKSLKKYANGIIIPAVLASFISIITELSLLIHSNILSGIELSLKEIIPPLFSFFIVYSYKEKYRSYKAVFSVISFYIFGGAFYSLAGVKAGVIIGIINGFLCLFVFKKMQARYSFLMIVSVSIILGIALGYSYDFYNEFLIILASFCKGRGTLFGFLNTVITAISGENDFSNLFYTTSFGGSVFYDNKILTGAVDIFKEGIHSNYVKQFLSGKFLLLFAIIGIIPSVKKNKMFFLLISIFTVISGDIRFYLITLLFVFPVIFVLFSIISGVCYLAADFLNIYSGFTANGSLIELIFYHNDIVLVLIIGLFVLSITYFVSRLVSEKIKW